MGEERRRGESDHCTADQSKPDIDDLCGPENALLFRGRAVGFGRQRECGGAPKAKIEKAKIAGQQPNNR